MHNLSNSNDQLGARPYCRSHLVNTFFAIGPLVLFVRPAQSIEWEAYSPNYQNTMKIPRIVYAVLLVSVAGLNVCVAGAPKLIIDTDYNTIGDDG